MKFSYEGVPLPDYETKLGVEGHQPKTEEERKQGYVIRLWSNLTRLRCIFCPFECHHAGNSSINDMRLHLYTKHWLPFNNPMTAKQAPLPPPEKDVPLLDDETLVEVAAELVAAEQRKLQKMMEGEE